MLNHTVVHDILKIAERAAKLIDNPNFILDISGYVYEYTSRINLHYLRVCCYWSESDMDQYYQLQKTFDTLFNKSKYSNMNITVEFSSGI